MLLTLLGYYNAAYETMNLSRHFKVLPPSIRRMNLVQVDVKVTGRRKCLLYRKAARIVVNPSYGKGGGDRDFEVNISAFK